MKKRILSVSVGEDIDTKLKKLVEDFREKHKVERCLSPIVSQAIELLYEKEYGKKKSC